MNNKDTPITQEIQSLPPSCWGQRLDFPLARTNDSLQRPLPGLPRSLPYDQIIIFVWISTFIVAFM